MTATTPHLPLTFMKWTCCLTPDHTRHAQPQPMGVEYHVCTTIGSHTWDSECVRPCSYRYDKGVVPAPNVYELGPPCTTIQNMNTLDAVLGRRDGALLNCRGRAFGIGANFDHFGLWVHCSPHVVRRVPILRAGDTIHVPCRHLPAHMIDNDAQDTKSQRREIVLVSRQAHRNQRSRAAALTHPDGNEWMGESCGWVQLSWEWGMDDGQKVTFFVSLSTTRTYPRNSRVPTAEEASRGVNTMWLRGLQKAGCGECTAIVSSTKSSTTPPRSYLTTCTSNRSWSRRLAAANPPHPVPRMTTRGFAPVRTTTPELASAQKRAALCMDDGGRTVCSNVRNIVMRERRALMNGEQSRTRDRGRQ